MPVNDSLWSRLTFGGINDLLRKASRGNDLTQRDAARLLPACDGAIELARSFQATYEARTAACSGSGCSPGLRHHHRGSSATSGLWSSPLVVTLLSLHWRTLLGQLLLCLGEVTQALVTPVLLREFLNWLEGADGGLSGDGGGSSGESAPEWKGWVLAVALGLSGISIPILLHHHIFRGSLAALRMRQQAVAAVHAKVLRLSIAAGAADFDTADGSDERRESGDGESIKGGDPAAEPEPEPERGGSGDCTSGGVSGAALSSGYVSTLIGADVRRFDDCLPHWPYLIASPLLLLAVLFMVSLELDFVSAAAGVATSLAVIPAEGLLAIYIRKLRSSRARCTDERVRIMAEAVEGQLAVKMSGLEDSFERRLRELRARESVFIRRAARIHAVNMALYTSISAVVSFVTFTVHRLRHGSLNVSGVFYALSLLQLPAAYVVFDFVNALQSATEMGVSLQRIQAFLDLPELPQHQRPVGHPKLQDQDYDDPRVGSGNSATTQFTSSPKAAPQQTEQQQQTQSDSLSSSSPPAEGQENPQLSASLARPLLSTNRRRKALGALTGSGSVGSAAVVMKGVVEMRGGDYDWRWPLGGESGWRERSSCPLEFAPTALPFRPSSSGALVVAVAFAVAATTDVVDAGVKAAAATGTEQPSPRHYRQRGRPTLRGVRFLLAPGQLLGVVGPTGSGKSSLLAALLGELQPLQQQRLATQGQRQQEPFAGVTAAVQAPVAAEEAVVAGGGGDGGDVGGVNVVGRVAFCDQIPWITAGSVRDNILFGLPYEQEWYDTVVRACCLEDDLAGLPYGDRTELGEGGAGLSGGQKARVALARAVYCRPHVALLDDPLSAVDPRVARQLFSAVLGPTGLLATHCGATRVLVTHQEKFLPACDRVLDLEAGEVRALGSWDEVARTRAQCPAAAADVDSTDRPDTADKPSNGVACANRQRPQDQRRLCVEEEQQVAEEDKHVALSGALRRRLQLLGGAAVPSLRAPSRLRLCTSAGGDRGGELSPAVGQAAEGYEKDKEEGVADEAEAAQDGQAEGHVARGRVAAAVRLAGMLQLVNGGPGSSRRPASSCSGSGDGSGCNGSNSSGSESSDSSSPCCTTPRHIGNTAAATAAPSSAQVTLTATPTAEEEYDSDGGVVDKDAVPAAVGVATAPAVARPPAAAAAAGGGAGCGPCQGQSAAATAAVESDLESPPEIVIQLATPAEAQSQDQRSLQPRSGAVAAGVLVMGGRADDNGSGRDREVDRAAAAAAPATDDTGDTDRGSPPDVAAALMRNEDRQTGTVPWSVYGMYCRCLGLPLLAAVVAGLLGCEAAHLAADWWLALWSAADPEDQARSTWQWVYGLLTGLVLVTSFGYTLLFFEGAVNAADRLHRDMTHRVLRAPISFFHTTPAGRILNRFSKDQGLIDDLLPGSWAETQDCAMLAAGAFVLVAVAVPYVLPALLPLAVAFGGVRRRYLGGSREMRRWEAVTYSPIYSFVGATVRGLPSIRAFGACGRFQSELLQLVALSGQWSYASNLGASWIGLRLDTISATTLLLAALMAVAVRRRIDIEVLALALTNCLTLTTLMQFFVQQSAEVENKMTSVERMLSYTQLPSEPPRVAEGGGIPPPGWPTSGELRFCDITASYQPGLPPVLRGVSFVVPAGTTCGVVGRTGCGKSSLLLALLRMLHMTHGSVRLDGRDVATIGLDALRCNLAIIPQDPVLFSGTLRSNLDPWVMTKRTAAAATAHGGSCGRDDAALWAVLRAVRLAPAVRALPGGLDARVAAGGGNLSTGQRQLLCLCRALLGQAAVLALDEATANVDGDTDGAVQTALRDFLRAPHDRDCSGGGGGGGGGGRVALVIAHRLETVLDTDQLVVLSEGEVEESGPPGELLANRHGALTRMVAAASEAPQEPAAAVTAEWATPAPTPAEVSVHRRRPTAATVAAATAQTSPRAGRVAAPLSPLPLQIAVAVGRTQMAGGGGGDVGSARSPRSPLAPCSAAAGGVGVKSPRVEWAGDADATAAAAAATAAAEAFDGSSPRFGGRRLRGKSTRLSRAFFTPSLGYLEGHGAASSV